MPIFIVIEAKLDPKQLDGKFNNRKEEIEEALTENLLDWGFELQVMRVVEYE